MSELRDESAEGGNKAMNIEVLIATMNQEDHDLLRKMNIQSDVIVGNQCNINEVENFSWNGHKIKWLSFAERGVGLNRNNTLMRASGDIVILADDDLVYVPNYDKVVEDVYLRLADADVVIFNLQREDGRRTAWVSKDTRITWRNYMRYGAARVTARLKPLRLHGILFNQCFGGGTEHSCGEDTLFLTSCLRAGLKIYAVPEVIAELKNERESTWFQGYTDKYLCDKGILFRVLSKRFWKLLCLQDSIRHAKLYQRRWHSIYRCMVSGEAEQGKEEKKQ